MDCNSVIAINEATNMTISFWIEIICNLLTVLSAVGLTAFLAHRYGLLAYFTQRKHEQIMKRYLDEGIDRAEASIEHAVGVFTDNNRTALNIVSILKQKMAGLTVEEKDYSPAFRKYEQQYFDSIPFVKIQRLVGDTIFWKSAQLLYAFVDAKSIWFENDFRVIVKNVIECTIDISIEQLLEKTKIILNEYFEDSKKYLYILLELESIANILEKESKLTWSKLGDFKARPDIQKSVQTLKGKFAEDLKCFEQKSEEEN